ncbi:MAG: leucine-rich repeat protein [Clostridia bacterium]|nr:leucine-rich repeat protein [Clostridia bacterium]
MRKNIVVRCISVLMLATLLLTANAMAADGGSCGPALNWALDGQGTLTITGAGEMTSYPWDKAGVKKIVVKSGATSIIDRAFNRCTNLTEGVLPDSLTVIGSYAFSGCSSLKSMTVPKDVKRIESYTFKDCRLLSDVQLPSGLTFIGNYSFSGCETLKEIRIPGAVTAIGWYAFSGCRGLTETTIPAGVKQIGTSAFSNCTGLAKVTVLGTETSFAEGVCSGCNPTVYCYQGSTAETWAAKNGYKTVYLGAQPADVDVSVVLTRTGKNDPFEAVMDGTEYGVDAQFANGREFSGLSFKSAKPKIASVDKTTGKLTLNAAGKTTITASAIQSVQKGSKTVKKKVTASVALTVVDPTIPTQIAIDQGSSIEVFRGKPEVQLTVSAEPSGTADPAVTWKSSKPKIVKVASDGTLTLMKAGTAKITATSTKNKKVKATVTVKVTDLTIPTGVSIEAASNELAKGSSLQLNAVLSGVDAEVPAVSPVTWKTSNKKIAKVDSNGLVSGIKPGTVKITVTTKIAKKSDSITLTVVEGSGGQLEAAVTEEPAIEEPAAEGPGTDEPDEPEAMNDWYVDGGMPEQYEEF